MFKASSSFSYSFFVDHFVGVIRPLSRIFLTEPLEQSDGAASEMRRNNSINGPFENDVTLSDKQESKSG